MEPGFWLLKIVANPRGEFPPEYRDLESIRALRTLVTFPPTLLSRVSPELEEMICHLEPNVVQGTPLTLSYFGELFHADKGGWDFVTAALEPDPEKRPTATQLLQHPWLR